MPWNRWSGSQVKVTIKEQLKEIKTPKKNSEKWDWEAKK